VASDRWERAGSRFPCQQRTVAAFAALCERAQPYGLRPVLEFMVFTAVKTATQALAIVERAGHPAGGVLVDPLHLARAGGSPAEVAALVAAHPARFPYMQLCDAPLAAPDDLYREAVEDRLPAGEGELPLDQLLAAMPPGVPLSVETPVRALAGLDPAERARRALAATRRLLETER
jgi:sugar phosphate isomerase/epimerase